MIQTIALSSCVSVQGIVVAQRVDGKIVVSTGERTFVGFPVTRSKG
ncbi:MAG: hypothetical protein ACK4TB_15210 [Gemmobacter sp.]